MCRDLERRHLPLLVDAGGRPQPWQEAIFERCTHAVLLTRDDASRAEWQARAARHGLSILADLRSDLAGQTTLSGDGASLSGTVAGLDRSRVAADPRPAEDPLLQALVARLASLFECDADALRRAHYDAAPVETVVDLERLARALDVPHRGQQAAWTPAHLPAAIDYLPAGVPLGLYGRGPNWLYAALALLAHPAPVWQFDVRLGWVTPPTLACGAPEPGTAQVAVREIETPRGVRLDCTLPRGYVDYVQADQIRLPALPPDRGAILSGKVPHWLLNGMALAYAGQPWMAVYQPQVEGAVVVYAPDGALPVGRVL
jgi:CRISPR-associated protein Csx3